MTFERHGLEAFGHIRLVHPVEVNSGGRLLQDQVDHLPQIGTGSVAQVRQGLAHAPGQLKQRRAVWPRLDVGRHHLFAQAHHLIAVGVELIGLRRVVVGDQQVATALHHAHDGIVNVERNQPALEGAKGFAQTGHPGREKSKCQGMRHSELDHVLRGRGVAAQHGTCTLQGLQHLHRLVVQGFAGGCEPCGVTAAVHQVGTRPGLQRLDAPRKRGLGHMAQLRRPAEAACFSQRDEIFKPFGFHGTNYARIA